MLTNAKLNFDDMSARYGEAVAYHYLEQIERAAGIIPQSVTYLDPALRLANACRIQDIGIDADMMMDILLAA